MTSIQNDIVTRSVYLHPLKAFNNLEENLLFQIKNDLEGKCWPEGYIIKVNKINKRTEGKINNLSFDGNIVFNVQVNVDLSNPKEGDIISGCTVVFVNKVGVFCKKEYLNIIIPADASQKTNLPIDYLESIKPGNNLTIKVIASQNEIKKDHISIWAEYTTKDKK
jgi:DNA-directed RNA polymerase subunit E'/Rpb7